MRIKEVRESRKIKQKDLAKAVGIRANTLSQYETGQREADYKTLINIARSLDSSPNELLGFEPSGTQKIGEFVEILHIASISAGYNGMAVEDIYERVSVPSAMLKGYPPEECRLMTVKGDSMYPYYMNGDKVVVHIQPSVDSGDIAVIIYDTDEATIKRVNYVYGEDWLELVPINPEYQTKRIENEELELCKVYGKVISSMRY